MKKILLMSFEYPVGEKYCGGVGQMVRLSRETFKNFGHEVYVLISSEFQKKYPVKVLMPDDTLKKFATFSAFRKALPLEGFDYVVQHFVNWVKELEKICKKTNIVYHFHSLLRRERESGFKTVNRFLINQERLIRIAHKVVCPSRFEYDNFMRYFPEYFDKAILIENTIQVHPPQKEDIEQIREKLFIDEGDIVSIYVGRLEKIKGAEILIEHLPGLLSKYRNKKVIIVGKVLERRLFYKLKILLRRFPRQLFYYKYLKKEMLFQYYYLSDIFVNPSLSESFSLATHECAYCETALLLNPLPAFDKFGDSAVFFEGHDEKENKFIKSYEKLLCDKNRIRKLARRARKIARKELKLSSFYDKLSKIIEF
jgi:glycosyltransferase involved in cell wall biosynthesis